MNNFIKLPSINISLENIFNDLRKINKVYRLNLDIEDIIKIIVQSEFLFLTKNYQEYNNTQGIIHMRLFKILDNSAINNTADGCNNQVTIYDLVLSIFDNVCSLVSKEIANFLKENLSYGTDIKVGNINLDPLDNLTFDLYAIG